MECKCQTTIVEGHRLTDYMCPLHKSALDLYGALKGILYAMDYTGWIDSIDHIVVDEVRKSRKALLKAEGK